jgi:DNA-binding beta-propeller fold protein YncE
MMNAYPSMRITRRAWSLGLIAFASCGRKKATGFPGYALVSTSGENSLAVVDLTRFRLVKQVDLGAPPTAVVTTSGRSFVLTPSSGSVHMIDADLRRVSSRRLADGLSGLRLSADGKLLFAISSAPAQFIVVNPRTLEIIRRHNLDAAPVSLDVASSPYAAVSTRASLHLFQLETSRKWRAQMPGEVGTVRFRADGQLLLAANLGDRSLTALNVPALQVVTDLPLAMKPENLCFNADAGQLFVSGDGMDAIAIVFPYDTLEVEQTILAGRDPGVMACSADPAYLFVASHSGSDVCILGIDNRKMIGIVEVGVRPSYITVTPDSQYALVLDELSGDMAVIRVTGIRTNAEANRTKSGAALVTMIPVGARPVHAAIVPKPLG